MQSSLLLLGVAHAGDHSLIILSLLFFLGTLGYLFYKGMLVTSQAVSLALFSLSCIFVLFPILVYSNKRDYLLSSPCQWLVFGIAITWAIAIVGFMRRPMPLMMSGTVQWRFVPQRAWLLLFACICTLDPLITIARFGKIGVMYGSEMMGSGGDHKDVITGATILGWMCGSVASTMLQTDYFASQLNWKQFVFGRQKWIDLGLVLFCLACNSTTGNRFILIMNCVGFAGCLAIFNRLRIGYALFGCVVLVIFFTILGNYRIGRAEIKERLIFETGIKFVDSSIGWLATYTEPIFPTLDAFVQNAPSPQFGGAWVNTVAPTALGRMISKQERTSPIAEMADLIPHYGLTFRTMYADLLFDWGSIGALLVGLLVLSFSIYIYNHATQSPWNLALYINTFQMFSFMALLATFYTQVPFGALLLLFIVTSPSSRYVEQQDVLPGFIGNQDFAVGVHEEWSTNETGVH